MCVLVWCWRGVVGCGCCSNGASEEWVAGEQSDLFRAVVEGELERLRAILDTGVDPSLTDSEVSG